MKPEGIGVTAGVNTAEGEDFICLGQTPEHTGLLVPFVDDGFTAGLDDSGTDEVVFSSKSAVLHARNVVHEVAQSGFHLSHFALSQSLSTGRLDDALHAIPEQEFFPILAPTFAADGILTEE
jgi:hypothetical protein